MRDVFNVGCVECDICGVWMECSVRIWDVCSVGGVLSVGRMGCDQQVLTTLWTS